MLAVVSSLQETEWNARNRRTGVAVGPKCSRCVRLVRDGYPLLTWEQALSSKSSSPDFAASLETAFTVFAEAPYKPPFERSSFNDNEQRGYRFEQPFTLVSEEDIAQKVGDDTTLSAKELAAEGVVIEKITDASGHTLSGVLLPAGAPAWQQIKTHLAQNNQLT